MTLLVDTPAVAARFDAVCRAVAADRRGITLLQLGQAHALARELESEDPDQERVGDLCARLGIDVEAIG